MSALGDTLKHDAAETAISTLLNNELPLKLDASAVYPIVNVLPGGPFQPKPLQLTANELNRPLPPGDYTIPMLTFCSEYSVHRPGYGTAYILGPMQGKAAGGIAALLWRGTLEKGRPPQQLQAVSWAIQSGLPCSQMPKTYQAVIDDVIPDHKNELNGDFIQSLEGVYQNYAKTMKLPPLDQQLAKMGKSGELALSAKRQREALLRQNTTDQIREQTLFQGQESGVYTPVRAEEGPWSVLVPNVMYARLKIVGGNLAANNVLEMRILPQSGPAVAWNHAPQFVLAGYRPVPEPPQLATTLAQWLQALWNAIGYPVGQGGQDLKPVLPPHPPRSADYPVWVP